MSILNFAERVMENKIFNAEVDGRKYTIVNLEYFVDIPQYGVTAHKDHYIFIVNAGNAKIAANKHDTLVFDADNKLLTVIPLTMRPTLYNMFRPEEETDWQVSMVDQECDGDIIHAKAVKRGKVFHTAIHMFDGNFIKSGHFLMPEYQVEEKRRIIVDDCHKRNGEVSKENHLTYGWNKDTVYCFVEDDEDNYAMARIYVQVDYVGMAGHLHDGGCVIMPIQLANDLPELADYFAL